MLLLGVGWGFKSFWMINFGDENDAEILWEI